MLIRRDGSRIGSISGGCLEGEISQKAWWYTGSGKPVVRVYDTSSDDDAVWEFGLGCNGVVQVMLERVGSGTTRETLEFLRRSRASRCCAVVATVIRTHGASGVEVGDRMFVDQDHLPFGRLNDSSLRASVSSAVRTALREQSSRLVHIGGTEIFVEFIRAPQPLVIFGAGHDAVPLAEIAGRLGWAVTVADGRPSYVTRERFPGAERLVVMPHGDPLRDLSIRPGTAVVMMTHNYPMDRSLLPMVLEANPIYLGILGPRSRAERLFAERGWDSIPDTVNAPVGLDLGSDNPEVIALAVVAEIQAILAQRSGGMLKYRATSIHQPFREIGVRPDGPVHGERPSFCEAVGVVA